MARATRKPKPSEDHSIVRIMPAHCPICEEHMPDLIPAATDHLQGHAPAEVCQRCEGKEKGWRLDWDLANHPRPDVSLFFCSNCGRYAPIAP
jgi:hypothetical protein